MASAHDITRAPVADLTKNGDTLPPLEAGDCLDQPTFHARYEAMPEHVKVELIEGVVYMPSPLKRRHGRPHSQLMGWLVSYEEFTPGTESLDNTTNILGPKSEPQPDAMLIVQPEFGGQTVENEDGYLQGPPEFVAEIASSSESIDLHGKRREYERAGVREYLVIVIRQRRVVWWAARHGQFVEIAAGADGIFRSEVFPGLWLDAGALLRSDTPRLLAVVRQGLAAPEHAAFVARLAAGRRSPSDAGPT
jgi:Uma2 family endonuclease